MARCPVTFQECKAVSSWRCALCKRSFMQGAEAGAAPSCLFCGVTLGRHLPAPLLQMPALCC